MKAILEHLLSLPPVAWREFADGLNAEQLSDLVRELDGRAEAAAALAGYFSERQLARDHDRAVRRSNRARNAVRRSLGYTYDQRYSF